ncbi:MAG: hypothetical protein A2817_00475 [Candidatus Yanofskybacteria bacterium RIFCSPHIGHO2_01_FULL_39_8b]|uniref:FCP1 homology domain-containing protein n=1 Tax=Candidatus Yanofskybacteria bacterium RIFCSPHIGHO2_01_FULL_39_8b TaxID=1802659 RepID=A0A1F8EEP4_9BACT|nr:MAG: hypothetical protein A2817_00475 [Candidatus Yanofskybacteria bacterium RIFCSPHIGHO2_01_FULL_39_8b]
MNKFNIDPVLKNDSIFKSGANKKPVIGFDMDGVILDNADAKIKIAKKHGFEIKLHHTPTEIIRTVLPQIILEKLQKVLYGDHPIAMSTPLMRGVRTVLAEVKRRKILYFLISRRKIPEVAVKLLKKRAIWPDYFNFENSFFVAEPVDKDKKAAELGITHYIDDEQKIINILSSVPNKFLFDRFNVFKKTDYYIKIKSWSEFKKHIWK